MCPRLSEGMYLPKGKRMKFHTEDADYSLPDNGNGKSRPPAQVIDYSDVFALSKLLAGLDDGKYGSVTKEYETLHAQRMEVINLLSSLRPSLASSCASPGLKSSQAGLACSDQSSGRNQVNPDQHIDRSISHVVIDLDVDPSVDISVNNDPENKEGKDSTAVIILDSDEEDGGNQVGIKHSPTSELKACNTPAWLDPQLQLLCQRQAKLSAQEGNSNQLVPYEQGYGGLNCDVAVEGRRLPSIKFEKVVLRNVTEKQPIRCEKMVLKNEIDKQLSRDEKVVLQNQTDKQPIQGLLNLNYGVGGSEREGEELHNEVNVGKESVLSSSLISFVGMQAQSPGMESHNKEDKEISENDGLEDLWKDMSLAMECSKGAISSDESPFVQNGEDCEHSYILEDDLGLVCRICGVIQKSIETIFDFQWKKGTRTTRTYMSGSRNSKDVDEDFLCYGPKILDHRFIAADISVHPRHMKKMRPHQIEGFNFLVRNLLADKPGGCILAHAPGSGKTFMLISFIQSFLARDPDARPLVVLPKGILTTWKKEFQRWQVEDIPLYDFYSSNAINRTQQLEVLRNWEESRSILFLGYKQFANIVSGGVTDKISAACQERLLKVPSLLILDEGHTPRNENTDVLSSLAKVQTPCKVVLSGTLFQNHVKEVFNILNLVRPKFLKMELSRAVVNRVLSRVNISGRRPYKGCLESSFYDLVEETLQNDENYKRKITVIQDLRELTQNILHYYKGDFLEELPGLVDFTVLLKLSAKQKEIVQNLGKFEKFKRSSVGSAVYIHPHLMDISKHAAGDRGSAFTDEKIDGMIDSMDIRDGVKTKFFLNILSMSESAGEKLLVFSQYLPPLKFLERLVVRTKGWRSGKEIFMISGDSSPEQRELSMEQFNSSPDAKVFFGSIKACGEGISLVGASRVVILDIHLNPSVTRQAIGRAFRPGQQKKVYTYRLVAADSPEEEDHNTSFRKELISKMWFEWSEYCGHHHFELDPVDVSNSQDMFLENPVLGEDIKALYRRNLSSLSQ